MKTSTRIIIIYFIAFFLLLGGSFIFNANHVKKNLLDTPEDLNINFNLEYKENPLD